MLYQSTAFVLLTELISNFYNVYCCLLHIIIIQ